MGPGAVIFVKRGVPHRSRTITGDLTVDLTVLSGSGAYPASLTRIGEKGRLA